MKHLGLSFLLASPAFAHYRKVDDASWSITGLGECLYTLTTDNSGRQPVVGGASMQRMGSLQG